MLTNDAAHTHGNVTFYFKCFESAIFKVYIHADADTIKSLTLEKHIEIVASNAPWWDIEFSIYTVPIHLQSYRKYPQCICNVWTLFFWQTHATDWNIIHMDTRIYTDLSTCRTWLPISFVLPYSPAQHSTAYMNMLWHIRLEWSQMD